MTIQLDDNWTIASDTYSWVLSFAEERVRTNQKTNEEELYLFEDKWFFPFIRQCLIKYKEEALKSTETVEEMLLKLDSIDKKIGEIKNDVFKVK